MTLNIELDTEDGGGVSFEFNSAAQSLGIDVETSYGDHAIGLKVTDRKDLNALADFLLLVLEQWPDPALETLES